MWHATVLLSTPTWHKVALVAAVRWVVQLAEGGGPVAPAHVHVPSMRCVLVVGMVLGTQLLEAIHFRCLWFDVSQAGTAKR